MTKTAAIVLAAGEGRRLGGVAKAALRLPTGVTFLDKIVAVAREAGVGRIVVVAGEPHLAVTRAAAEVADVDRIAVNPDPSRGMASSVEVGIEQVGDVDAALIWPVDHPGVRVDTIRQLLARIAREGLVMPMYGGRGGHPTLFGAELFGELRACVSQPGGARAVVSRVPKRVIKLPVEDPGVVEDVDEPTDLP